jgi:Predicted UDP-glucose 6-dehydrogenase
MGDFCQLHIKDKRVGDSHMMVPGHDRRYGFGGACLPKDANAIVQYAESLKVDLSLIKKTIKANNKIRAKYNNQTDREDEQNIKYNIKREE